MARPKAHSSPPTAPRLGVIAKLSRPFYTSLFATSLLVAYAVLARRTQPTPSIQRRKADDVECRLVHQAKDQCAFVLANCLDDEAGLLPYLKFYYCDLASAQPFAFALLATWLALLFTTIGIAASDFFSINLSTIASILGLSESLAGVTFLAFGNGSPDVFSTFAAMGSNSGSMAVGELIGAAGFITAVVAGSMALVREFKVVKMTFVRDICFFIVAVSFSVAFLADGHLHLWECALMVAFYVFYVFVVVGWHWWATRQKRRRQKEATSRGHFYGATTRPDDELEPYRDDDGTGDDWGEGDENNRPVGGGAARGGGLAQSAPDISALEHGPRIEIGGADLEQNDDDAEDAFGRDMQVAAEMTSSMRVNRPRGARSGSYTPLGQIRPSFVGALEFRSVLASLQNSSNVRLAPIHARRQSEAFFSPAPGRSTMADDASADAPQFPEADDGDSSLRRDRARSHGTLPLMWTFPTDSETPQIITESPTSPPPPSNSPLHPPPPHLDPSSPMPPPSRSSTTRDGSLAPPVNPLSDRTLGGSVNDSDATRSLPAGSPASLRLQIPSPRSHSSGYSSPAMSPFPTYSESPLPMLPHSGFPHTPQNGGHPGIVDGSYFGADMQTQADPRPVRWWPYSVLPPPHVFLGTLFPTLQGWRAKSIWDKFVSLISVPSIFLLVITLPVVETERGEEETGLGDAPHPGGLGLVDGGASALLEPRALSAEPETEWQRYRRSTYSGSISHPSGQTTPVVTIGLGSPLLPPMVPAASNGAGRSMASSRLANKPDEQTSLLVPHDYSSQPAEVMTGWNRWLVAIQIFAGPLFTVLIVWANMAEDLEQPGRTLLRLILWSVLGSLILLGLLLSTTSPDVRPRYHFFFCFLGFVISVAWISTVAGEVVGVLKAFGVILGISEAILGLTIFAVGNSLGDLVADITVARLGYPVMALAACFGGPMLNILLGIGIGGAWMTTKAAGEKHHNHPDKPLKYKPYHIEVGTTLMISAVTVLVTLIFLLVAVPSNHWVMSRKIGWSLIGIWSVSTAVNLVIEATGIWSISV